MPPMDPYPFQPCGHGAIARLTQALGILWLRPWARLGFRVRVRRAMPAPMYACVIAANHRSYLDPMFVSMWLRRPLAFFARADLWDVAFFKLMLTIMAGIPVDRDRPGASSTVGAVERLRSGIPVLVFPEGTRTRTGRLGQLRPGPALFARRAGVPVVPVYLHRTEAGWPRGRPLPNAWGRSMEIRFGSPVPPPPAHLPAHLHDHWTTRYLQRWMERQERDLYRDVKAPGASHA